jgi:hypothetical protein
LRQGLRAPRGRRRRVRGRAGPPPRAGRVPRDASRIPS